MRIPIMTSEGRYECYMDLQFYPGLYGTMNYKWIKRNAKSLETKLPCDKHNLRFSIRHSDIGVVQIVTGKIKDDFFQYVVKSGVPKWQLVEVMGEEMADYVMKYMKQLTLQDLLEMQNK